MNEALLGDAVAYIDRWMEYRQRALRLPGVAIAIGYRGRVMLSRAYGMADVEHEVPLTVDHAFRIASHSKTFTGTAVMQLVEQGRVRLDDHVGDHLDWLPSGPGQHGRATVRQLLSHSAGLIRDGETGGFWTLERDFPAAGEFRDYMRDSSPVFPQNDRFKYSNFGFALLGMLIEAVTGETYNSYVKRSIVDRLGMRNTGPELDAHALQRLATGYTPALGGLERMPLQHIDTRAMSAATGFYSTVEDLCRYGSAHFLGNEELLSDESKREMQREHWQAEDDRQYGLGLGVYRVGERRLVGHNGGFPGFATATRIDPHEQLVTVALTSASDGPSTDLAHGMLQIINRALEAPTDPAEHPEVDRDRLTGRYWSLGGATDVVRFGGKLLGIHPEAPNPTAIVNELRLEAPDVATIEAAGPFESPGERVRFFFDDGGHVARVQWGAQRLYPWDTFVGTILPRVQAASPAHSLASLSPEQDGV